MHQILMNTACAKSTFPEQDWLALQAKQRDASFGSKNDLPFVAWYTPAVDPAEPVIPLVVGDLCPKCQAGRLDYDGALNLACNLCGYAMSGGAGCT